MEPLLTLTTNYDNTIKKIRNYEHNREILKSSILSSFNKEVGNLLKPLMELYPTLEYENGTIALDEAGHIPISKIYISMMDNWGNHLQPNIIFKNFLYPKFETPEEELVYNDTIKFITNNQLEFMNSFKPSCEALKVITTKIEDHKKQARNLGKTIRDIVVMDFIQSLKDGITHTIDTNYRGEMKVIGWNLQEIESITYEPTTTRQGTLLIKARGIETIFKKERYSISNIGKSLYYYIVRNYNQF